jgi:hypothetical protein
MSKTQDRIEWLKLLGHIDSIDPEAINRFTDAALSYEDINQDDAIQAAALIVALKDGTFGGDGMSKQIRDILDIPRKPRTPKFKPEGVIPGEPAWEIVERIYKKKEISHSEGVELFKRDITPNVKRRTIQNYIAVIRLKVEKDPMEAFINLE